MAGELDGLKQSVDRMAAQLEQLSTWHEELQAARKRLTASAALEEQMLSIAGRLNEKWRENTDAVLRMREQVENMSVHITVMNTKFELLYDKLLDIIDCPFSDKDADRRRGGGHHGDGA